MTNQNDRGFTLIEVMIVVAIIGILAALAFPLYQDYSKRAKMSEVVLAGSTCRNAVTDVYVSGSLAAGWGCNITPVSHYVKSVIAVDSGVVQITATGFGDPEIDDKMITMTPFHDASTPKSTATVAHLGQPVYKWVCAPAPVNGIPVKYLPRDCRGG